MRAELTASQARIAAAADETRRRIERDLNDGAQQWLVTLTLRLRVVQASVPSDLAELRAELGQVAAALTSAHGVAPPVRPDSGAQRGLEFGHLRERTAAQARARTQAGRECLVPVCSYKYLI